MRTLSNPKRGCGTLKRGKAYVRGIVGSPDGVLPSFVRCDPFVPYREMGTDGDFTRGYIEFDGVSSQFALDDLTDFVRLYPGKADDDGAVENMVDQGIYASEDGAPAFEGQRHVDRLRFRGSEGADHFGAVDAVRQNDLLMRAGKTHYPDPGDFIDEAISLGISKAIPLSKRQEPPVIQPGITRMWVVHPDTEIGWGVIGYAYIDEIVFTQPEDGNVPQYVQEWADAGRLDVVDIEPPKAHEDDADLSNFGDDDGPDPEDDPRDTWQRWYSDGLIDYNDLRGFASMTDVETGQHPDAETLMDALAANGYRPGDFFVGGDPDGNVRDPTEGDSDNGSETDE